QVLSRGLGEARRGSGGLYLLIGEPGIGKSRCAAEFAARAGAEARVWFGLCSPSPSAPPVWPWLQIFRACGRVTARSSALHRECQALITALGSDAGEGDDRASQVPSSALLERARRLLLDALSEQPTLIVLDDLHDADESSLDLLVLLTPQLAKLSALVLGALRQPSLHLQDAKGPRLHEIRERAQGLVLHQWSQREVAAVVSSALPLLSGATEALVDLVWRRSGGNPLFAEELLRQEQLRGDTAEGRPERLDERIRRSLPGAVQDLVRRRLQQ